MHKIVKDFLLFKLLCTKVYRIYFCAQKFIGFTFVHKVRVIEKVIRMVIEKVIRIVIGMVIGKVIRIVIRMVIGIVFEKVMKIMNGN